MAISEAVKKWAIRIYMIVLTISVIGICLAYIGMLFEYDPLWRVGRVLALPLIVTVLPLCLFSLAMLLSMRPIFIGVHMYRWIRGRHTEITVQTGDEDTENRSAMDDVD